MLDLSLEDALGDSRSIHCDRPDNHFHSNHFFENGLFGNGNDQVFFYNMNFISYHFSVSPFRSIRNKSIIKFTLDVFQDGRGEVEIAQDFKHLLQTLIHVEEHVRQRDSTLQAQVSIIISCKKRLPANRDFDSDHLWYYRPWS
jgi:hypothetical protein